MRYLSEPPHDAGSPPKVGILLVNLGTPEAPTAAALRVFLKEFLSDPRVVEIPRVLWWPILNGFVLTTRPRSSVRKYAKIWTTQGSPLKVHTERQARLLGSHLGGDAERPALVAWAMRYGQPSVQQGLVALKEGGCDRVLVIPLYPQYSASTTASTYDALLAATGRMRNVPELRVVKHFHDHPGYIQALAQSVRDHWTDVGRPDKLILSFHGLPRFAVDRGDPYYAQCRKTAHLLAEALLLGPEQYILAFQSRFGRARWLEPYTLEVVTALGKQGTRRIDVLCPGFVSDCLETLEEIAIENKRAFQSSGGGQFHTIPCLNERPDWIRALADIAAANLQGWQGTWDRAPSHAAAPREQAQPLVPKPDRRSA
jgi:ferrochelatase